MCWLHRAGHAGFQKSRKLLGKQAPKRCIYSEQTLRPPSNLNPKVSMKIQLPRVPFLFFGPDGQMEVIVKQDLVTESTNQNSERRQVGCPYQAYIMNNLAADQPTPIMQIGVWHTTEAGVVDALLAGVDFDIENYRTANDPCRRALEALKKANGVKLI